MLDERSLTAFYEARNGDFSGLSIEMIDTLLSYGKDEIKFAKWYLKDLKKTLKRDKYSVTVLLDIDYYTDLIYKLNSMINKLEEAKQTLLNRQTQ